MPKLNMLCEGKAAQAADLLRQRLNITGNPEIVIMPGSGWAEALENTFVPKTRTPLNRGDIIPYSQTISCPNGHELSAAYGTIAGRTAVVAGRIHCYQVPAETHIPDKATQHMMRTLFGALMNLGPKFFLATAGVGPLPQTQAGTTLGVGDIVVVDNFFTLLAPKMPLFDGDDFAVPGFAISKPAVEIALQQTLPDSHRIKAGTHVMVRGPNIETTTDKVYLGRRGFTCIGMSLVPEACVAWLYNIPFLPLGLITNGWEEEHSHTAVTDAGKEAAPYLAPYLEALIPKLCN